MRASKEFRRASFSSDGSGDGAFTQPGAPTSSARNRAGRVSLGGGWPLGSVPAGVRGPHGLEVQESPQARQNLWEMEIVPAVQAKRSMTLQVAKHVNLIGAAPNRGKLSRGLMDIWQRFLSIYPAFFIAVALYWARTLNPLRALARLAVCGLAACYLAREMAEGAAARACRWRECLERAGRGI